MRFFEIVNEEKYNGLNNFVTMLGNLVGRSTSKRQQAPFNWEAVARMAKKSGFEVLGDPKRGYQTFKSLWDQNPQAKALLEPLIKNYNERGIELNVPGAEEPGDATEPVPGGGQDSEAEVGKIADANAAQQLAQNQAGIKV